MGAIEIVISAYQWYKSKKLFRNIDKLHKNIKEMIYEIDEKVEDIQNDVYISKRYDWKKYWDGLGECRDNLYQVATDVRLPVSNRSLSKRLDEYQIVMSNANKLADMLSLVGQKVDSLESNLLENLQDFEEYTHQISDFASIKQEDSVLIDKINKDKTNDYLNTLFNKIKEVPIVYSPSGDFVEENNWKTKINLKKGKLSAKNRHFFGMSLEVRCEHAEDIPSKEDLVDYANDMNQQKKAQVSCYIVNEINQNTKNIVENFAHSNLSVFCYDLKTEKLFYNKDELANTYFLGYFDPQLKPKQFSEFVRENSEDGWVGINFLNELNLKSSNPSLRSVGRISRISNDKYKIMEG